MGELYATPAFLLTAALGRSPATMAFVALYLLAIPGYLAYRIRVRDRDDETDDEPMDDDEMGDEKTNESNGGASDDETASSADEDGD